MKHFSEGDSYIGAACQKCGRILKIEKTSCSETENGFAVNPAVKCVCGNISSHIDCEPKKPQKLLESSSSNNSLPNKLHELVMTVIVVLVFMACIFLVGLLIDSSKGKADIIKRKLEKSQEVDTMKNKLSDSKHTEAIENEVTLGFKNAAKKSKKETYRKESCYQLGFRYGRCGAMVLKGYQCDPADDIVMPIECRGQPSDKGMRDGVASVY